MSFVLSSDDKYIPYCATTMLSIAIHNNGCRFFVMSEGLTDESKRKLNKIASKYECIVEYVLVQKEILDNLPMPKSDKLGHISLATYYRLFLGKLITEDVHKILYMDCDILVRGSLNELWATDIAEYALGAAYQIDKMTLERCRALDIPFSYGYFQAGVLLINLDYWRKNNLSQAFCDYISQNFDKIFYHDQDVLNAVLHEKVLRLPCKWNMTGNFFSSSIQYLNEIDEAGNIVRRNEDYKDEIVRNASNPIVIHYSSPLKPWKEGCTHIWRKEYLKYHKMAGYYGGMSFRDKSVIFFKIIMRWTKLDVAAFYLKSNMKIIRFN